MKYVKNKDTNSIIKEYIAKGWNFHRGKKHIKLVSPENKLVTISCTSSDYRSYLNIKHDLLRIEKT